MEVRVLRGAREVGGSCVELRHDGATLLLDLGRPLTARRDDVVPLPAATGLGEEGPLPLGVVISHGHADHWGLVPQLPGGVPVWWSSGTAAVLTAASFWGSGHDCSGDRIYRTGEPLSIGPFTVTPHLADHSAYDAHSLLVAAGGRRVLYTGDLRAHGRSSGDTKNAAGMCGTDSKITIRRVPRPARPRVLEHPYEECPSAGRRPPAKAYAKAWRLC